ncbi:MAG: helix-turn-helix transcriptional regulator [Bacteroidales bacterium]|nr:helix-turn-helix transcriptional regulator [Bacteroidales bacterium]
MRKGLSQKAFSELIDLNPVQYNRYENKGILPSSETLGKLACALEVSVDYLIEGQVEDAAFANFEDKDLLELFSEVSKLDPENKNYIKKVLADLVKLKKFEMLAS